MVGYGASIPEGRNREISVARQAEYLADWLKHLGIEQVVLAGHDLGGGVAQIAAIRYPDLCRGLFLTNAIGYDSWPIPSVKMMRAAGPLIQHLPKAVFKMIFWAFIRRRHGNRAQAEEAARVHWTHYQRHDGAAAFIHQVNALNVQDTLSVTRDLPRLGMPARIVWGAADQFQKIQFGEWFARDLTAPLHRIEQGRHFTPEDYPEIVAQEINRLLEDL
jgi:pimeloyl-ACP methyl ester carboxylesterase